MNSTIISFLFFTGLVGLITWLWTRKDDHGSSEGYFLGGRSLSFPLIAGSLLLTNLSTEQLVGLNGDAFNHGLHVMVWEVVAVIALVIMALFFLPKFLRSGIATVPQYLDVRYDHKTRMAADMIFLSAYAIILLPLVLYTGAQGLSSMMNVGELIGVENDTTVLWITVIFIGIIGSIYALFGGLRTVAVSDTLNGIGLLAGGFLIAYYGLQAVSGGQGMFEGLEIMQKADPERFNSLGGKKDAVPFSTIFSGVILLNMFYWCTNQQIIQRTFGASSLAEGQKGVLLTGALKFLGPVYLVIPGMIGFYLYTNNIEFQTLLERLSGGQNQNVKAYGALVQFALPPALTGFFAAAMVGAILSSFNSALNATCTLFSLGLYKEVINKDADEAQVVKSGKTFGIGIAIVSMLIAPMLAGQESIFGYLQKMNGIYFIPLFAVIVVGMLSKRVPALAAKVGMGIGFTVIPFCYFVPVGAKLIENINGFHFLGIVFAIIIVTMLIIGQLKPRDTDFVQEDVKAVDMTPWKHRNLAGAACVIMVFIIYATFADFSAVSKDHNNPGSKAKLEAAQKAAQERISKEDSKINTESQNLKDSSSEKQTELKTSTQDTKKAVKPGIPSDSPIDASLAE
ncbi:solute:sodium symporter family transporter [Lentisphaera marina]|uniref:solute:sodium symporter family transporter n=1 Tax=Lentisphaera marina TaxID=1111041 RepID=UPI0023656765|nr:solute:sodium symporter family transporter [Lentisphaera marina]MDD7984118.1 solute:sodium symporter family transporter [Lentisphaera marina]